MGRIDFFVSNPGHHLQMMLPVARSLGRREGLSCRMVSLCELRGFASPARAELPQGVGMRPVIPFKPRRSPATGAPAAPGRTSRLRRLARRLVWGSLLLPRLAEPAAPPPSLAVLPNDAAYPFDRIARRLRQRGVPFLLLQEGIRFPLPQPGEAVYGAGGADAVAAWGEVSAAYFRDVGVPADRIHLTGNPRFDAVRETDWGTLRRGLIDRLSVTPPVLLLITNPIDDQGFCSTAEKLELTERFVARLEPALRSGRLSLLLKPHGRESAAAYERMVRRVAPGGGARVVAEEPLWPLLSASDAAVIMASTAGLEALLFGLSLGVMQLPGGEYAFDYVDAGAALPIPSGEPAPGWLERLLEPKAGDGSRAKDFLAANLVGVGESTQRVESLIVSQIERHGRR